MILELRKVNPSVITNMTKSDKTIGEDEMDVIASLGELKAKSRARKLIFDPHSLYKFRFATEIIENIRMKKTT